MAAENKRAEDSFKAKSDESEQVVATLAATSDKVVAVSNHVDGIQKKIVPIVTLFANVVMHFNSVRNSFRDCI